VASSKWAVPWLTERLVVAMFFVNGIVITWSKRDSSTFKLRRQLLSVVNFLGWAGDAEAGPSSDL